MLVPDLRALTSVHDRARELFYYLKGGRVDYGEAHSAACGHARFGRAYARGHYPLWDEAHPVHLVGHSAGARPEDGGGRSLRPACLLQICRSGSVLYHWLDLPP